MTPLSLELPTGPATFHTLVLDFTGTLSEGGKLIPGMEDRLRSLVSKLRVVVLTADTFGTAKEALRELPVAVQVIRDGGHKAEVVAGMGPEGVVAIGNGRNDVPMMGVAGLGIAVIGHEGAAADLVSAADVVTRDIRDALDLILDPLRLKATLRD